MKIGIVGSGNVASHLGIAFAKAQHQINFVWSPSSINADELAQKLGTTVLADLAEIPDTDLILVAVKDDAIATLLHNFKHSRALLVHTAGSVASNIFEQIHNYGVFYPLQTLNKEKKQDLTQVPICIEANSEQNLAILQQLASEISSKVYQINSQQRLALHLAAVFSSNFSHHLNVIAAEILKKERIDFEILKPLIAFSAEKIIKSNTTNLNELQTGPAKRQDFKTMDKHLSYLENENSALKELYQMLSNSIANKNKKDQ